MKPIVIAKCDLLLHHHDAKEISINYFLDTKLCTKHKKTHANPIYTVKIIFVRQTKRNGV